MRKSQTNGAQSRSESPHSGAGVENPHTALANAILIESSKYSWLRLFPNPQGVAQTRNGAWITYGMGEGTSDIVGAGHHLTLDVAVAVFVEVKTGKGRLEEKQKSFRKKMLEIGAIHIVARSLEQVMSELKFALGRGP